MKYLQLKMECLILSFYIIDTLFTYFDIVQLLWHNLYYWKAQYKGDLTLLERIQLRLENNINTNSLPIKLCFINV